MSTAPRVLVADQSLPNRRLIREFLTAFLHCEVDDASSAEHAFERALLRPYRLFIFSYSLPDMGGPLLDRLLSKVYTRIHTKETVAPSVIYLVQPQEITAFRSIERDARVKGSVPLPLNLEALRTTAGSVLSPAQPKA